MTLPAIESPDACLAATPCIDVDHPAVQAFVADHAPTGKTPRETAVALYYAVRDGLRYDPYTFETSAERLRASHTLAAGRGMCITKAIVLAAALRAVGIPAGLGFADVKNHLSTARLRELMQTDVFYWHGYTTVWLDGAWVKATPAFNIELCDKFRLKALEFDGREDSIYHAFDLEGRRHMEYVNFRGEFADVPQAELDVSIRELYPSFAQAIERGDFEREVDVETRIAG